MQLQAAYIHIVTHMHASISDFEVNAALVKKRGSLEEESPQGILRIQKPKLS